VGLQKTAESCIDQVIFSGRGSGLLLLLDGMGSILWLWLIEWASTLKIKMRLFKKKLGGDVVRLDG